MYSHDDFAKDVIRNFEFLESEYALRREPMHVEGAGCWVAYGSPTVRVIVEHELGNYCGVTIQNVRHVKRDPLERSEFDLEEIVAVSGLKQPRRQDPRSPGEAVGRAAETLRAVGEPVLKGEFEALHTRQLKLVEALRKSQQNPLEPS